MRRKHPLWLFVPSLWALVAAPTLAQAGVPAGSAEPEGDAVAPSQESASEAPPRVDPGDTTPPAEPEGAARPTTRAQGAAAAGTATTEVEGVPTTGVGAEVEAVPAAEPEPAQATTTPAAATTEAEAEVEAEATAEAEVDEDAESSSRWFDDLSFGAFVDAYVGFNTNMPRPQAGANVLRAFDAANGFSLAWAGVNTSYDGDRAGATVDLRFGTGPNAGWADDAIPGIQHVKQAYASWHALPEGKLSFDLGRFDTIYGAEVAESWLNHTYTRGALYNLAQPFWHTGLRVGSQITDTWAVKGLLVNGWGHVIDNNMAKSLGLQLAFTPGEVFGLYAGYLGGAESDDVDPETGVEVEGANWALRHLADLVLTVNVRRLSLAFNADWIYDDTPAGLQQWYGGMLSAHFQARPWIGFGARAEYLGDPDGFMSGVTRNQLATGTLSLDLNPAEKLTIRLDARGDGSVRSLFPTGSATPTEDETMPDPPALRQQQVTLTLGMVVHSF